MPSATRAAASSASAAALRPGPSSGRGTPSIARASSERHRLIQPALGGVHGDAQLVRPGPLGSERASAASTSSSDSAQIEPTPAEVRALGRLRMQREGNLVVSFEAPVRQRRDPGLEEIGGRRGRAPAPSPCGPRRGSSRRAPPARAALRSRARRGSGGARPRRAPRPSARAAIAPRPCARGAGGPRAAPRQGGRRRRRCRPSAPAHAACARQRACRATSSPSPRRSRGAGGEGGAGAGGRAVAPSLAGSSVVIVDG